MLYLRAIALAQILHFVGDRQGRQTYYGERDKFASQRQELKTLARAFIECLAEAGIFRADERRKPPRGQRKKGTEPNPYPTPLTTSKNQSKLESKHPRQASSPHINLYQCE